MGNQFQQGGIFVLQSGYLRFEGGDFVFGFLQQGVQFGRIQFVFRDGGLHGALFRVGAQRAAALPALVLRRTLTERGPVRAGHADGHALAALQLGGIRRLVIIPCVGSDIIGIALLVVVELRKTGVQLCFERIQIHRVGIEDIFVDDLFPVPAFLHMDFVGVCLLGLLAAPADDIGAHPIVDGVSISVILVVELLYPAARPSRMPFRVGERLLALGAVPVVNENDTVSVDEIRFGDNDSLAAIEYAVVVRRRVVVA